MKEYFQAIHEIIKLGHHITDAVSRELKEYDISEPQYNVLKILKGANAPITVQTIQEQMVQKSSNVTRLIDKLVVKKLVIRQECSSNRRKMDISITKNGEEFLRKLDRVVVQFHEPMKQRLGQTELVTLKELIEKLKDKK